MPRFFIAGLATAVFWKHVCEPVTTVLVGVVVIVEVLVAVAVAFEVMTWVVVEVEVVTWK